MYLFDVLMLIEQDKIYIDCSYNNHNCFDKFHLTLSKTANSRLSGSG